MQNSYKGILRGTRYRQAHTTAKATVMEEDDC